MAGPLRLPLPLRARWERNLFVHFRVSAASMRPLLPPGVEPDLHDGDAWLSATAQLARGPAPVPDATLGLAPPYPQVVLCAHVVHDGEPGIYLLAGAVPSAALAAAGRALLAIPFAGARIRYTESPDGALRLHVTRARRLGDVSLSARPRREPWGPPRTPLASFLLDRYAVFGGGGRRPLAVLRFDRPEWSVVEADASAWNVPFFARFDLGWGGAPDAVYVAAGATVRFRDVRAYATP